MIDLKLLRVLAKTGHEHICLAPAALIELLDDYERMDAQNDELLSANADAKRDLANRDAALAQRDRDFDALREQLRVTTGQRDGAVGESITAQQRLYAERDEARQERDALRALINSPQTADFLEAVRIEAAHQVERWPSEHDAGKSDADWFWLIGYLAGKALRNDTVEKKLHHIITTAAVCLNWHRHATGENTAMRPGIAPPEVA